MGLVVFALYMALETTKKRVYTIDITPSALNLVKKSGCFDEGEWEEEEGEVQR